MTDAQAIAAVMGIALIVVGMYGGIKALMGESDLPEFSEFE